MQTPTVNGAAYASYSLDQQQAASSSIQGRVEFRSANGSSRVGVTVPGTEPASELEAGRTDRSKERKVLEEVAERIEEVVQSFQRDLHFQVHKDTGIMYVQVTDAREGKILRELPMEQILDTMARIERMIGLLVDGEA